MIIARLSPGLANQMMEYAASYALAKELGEELVLDIAECKNSPFGYLLDFFNIPDTKKILYYMVDAEQAGHLNLLGIPNALKEQVIIFTQAGNWQPQTIEYKELNNIPEYHGDCSVYMCGYFFNRFQYYDKYWDEIKKKFSLRIEIEEVNKFRELISNKISVGIHIRRGDMLLADWAVTMEGDYYKAAITYCRKHFGNCIFCVFSDDIAYAKQLLGKDSSIYYTHFWGYDDADIAEFVCLSLCNHRILSNSSTFGRLADGLNEQDGGFVFWQAIADSNTIWQHWINKYTQRKNTKKRLDKYDINKYAAMYKSNGKDNIANWRERVDKLSDRVRTEDTSGQKILEEIAELSLNTYEASPEDDERILYYKFIALMREELYHEALMPAHLIYETYINDYIYRNNLVRALKEVGADKEAELELNRTLSDRHFIIVPRVKSFASNKLYGLIELGYVLHHMGYKVSFLFDPIDDGEKYYIEKNEMLTDRYGNCLGCYQYVKQEIESRGFEQFLMEQKEDELIVVTRDSNFCGQRVGNKMVTYVFPDYSDSRDAETDPDQKRPKEELKFLYNTADMILTHAKDNINSNHKVILCKDDAHKEEYWIEEKRWKFGDLHRLDERAISMAQVLVDNL